MSIDLHLQRHCDYELLGLHDGEPPSVDDRDRQTEVGQSREVEQGEEEREEREQGTNCEAAAFETNKKNC